jgi:hypothetical protein
VIYSRYWSLYHLESVRGIGDHSGQYLGNATATADAVIFDQLWSMGLRSQFLFTIIGIIVLTILQIFQQLALSIFLSSEMPFRKTCQHERKCELPNGNDEIWAMRNVLGGSGELKESQGGCGGESA